MYQINARNERIAIKINPNATSPRTNMDPLKRTGESTIAIGTSNARIASSATNTKSEMPSPIKKRIMFSMISLR